MKNVSLKRFTLAITALVFLGVTAAGCSSEKQSAAAGDTDPKCYEAANAGAVGQLGWNGCGDQYIVKNRAELAQAVKDGFKITHKRVEYTFGDNIHNVFTGQITDMQKLFIQSSFNEDIGYWDTSNVTDMNYIFQRAQSFNQDIGSWDTSNVTDMRNMFHDAVAFNQDIGDWDTSNVTNMSTMFNTASAFNQDIGDWDVTQIENRHGYFDMGTPSEWTADKKPVWGTAGK